MTSEPDCHGDQVEELLADWELSRLDGRELSAEELARECPELLEKLQEGIAALKRTSWVLEDIPNEPDSSDNLDPSQPLPESSLCAEEFASIVEESGVLPRADLSQLIDLCREESTLDSASGLATRLVERGALTRYQAHTLLTGSDDPLMLDRYIILDLIGAGGMGLVFKALHRSMERVVAIKILPPGAIDSPAKAERFRREIKAVAKLNHPNIVAAHDAHESEGTHFLVMEYVTGRNLAELVRDDGPVAVGQAAAIISRIAGALGEAHRQGIIHRDVKPSNILLSDEGVPKLLDLGIARTREPVDEGDELTVDGIPVGTVAYIAPEQIHGDVDVDERADIYGLGCTLYFLITGKPLFEKKSGIQVVAAHLTEEPPSLSSDSADFPASIERVFERMVAKDRSNRFDSMAGVITALEATGLIGPGAAPPIRTTAEADAAPKDSVAHNWRLFRAASIAAAVLGFGGLASYERGLWGAGDLSAPGNQSPVVDQTQWARWVLAHNGRLIVQNASGFHECQQPEQLPDSPFDVVAAEVRGAGAAARLNDLRSLPKLANIVLADMDLNSEALSAIASMRPVVDLGLIRCGLTDRELEPLAEMDWLQKISLAGNAVSDDGIKELVPLQRLRTIVLSQTAVTNGCLDKLAAFPQLSELDLRGCAVTGAVFGEASGLPSLRSLSVSEIDVSPEHVGALRELSGLSELLLHRVALNAELIDALASLESLRSLSLAGSNLTDASLERLAALPRLEGLDAERTKVSKAGVARFKELRPDVEIAW